MKVLYNNKMIEVKDELVKAINRQQNIDDVKSWMENYELVTDVNNLSRAECLKVYSEIDKRVWADSGETESDVLQDFGLIKY